MNLVLFTCIQVIRALCEMLNLSEIKTKSVYSFFKYQLIVYIIRFDFSLSISSMIIFNKDFSVSFFFLMWVCRGGKQYFDCYETNSSFNNRPPKHKVSGRITQHRFVRTHTYIYLYIKHTTFIWLTDTYNCFFINASPSTVTISRIKATSFSYMNDSLLCFLIG